MKTSPSSLQELIARRLVKQATGSPNEKTAMAPRKKQPPVEATALVKTDPEKTLESPELIRLEKNLSSLCFFTPSSTKDRGNKGKSFSFTRMVDGKKVEARVTIAPSVLHRLPTTADQDKYFALQKIINELKQTHGQVSNPISFTSAELLRLLGRTKAGKHYDEIAEWLMVMTSTTVVSEGAVYLANKKKFARDVFHVFERAYTHGQELPDGTIADQNYVWLSSWQLENINHNYLLPVDFDTYKELKNHISKALVPLLQIWLYASRETGSFEKRYDEICQMLDLRQYSALSKIKEKFGPALDELRQHGYLAAWAIEPTNDKKHYKVVLWPGVKFQSETARRITPTGEQSREVIQALPFDAEPAPNAMPAHPLIEELTKRGILSEAAQSLLVSLAPDQPVLDQLEYADWLIAQGGKGKFRNPPGFYLYLLKSNVSVPEDFETSRRRELREQARTASARAERERLELEEAYEQYRHQLLDRYIAEHFTEAEYAQRLAAQKAALTKQSFTRNWTDGALTSFATITLRAEIAKAHLTYESFEDFGQRRRTKTTKR